MIIPRPQMLSRIVSFPCRRMALPIDTAHLLSAEYEIDVHEQRLFRTRDGVHNTNAFVLGDGRKQFFLREHVIGADADSLAFEHSLLDHLHQNNFPVATPLRTVKGHSYVSTGDRYYVLFDFVPGYIYSQYYLSKQNKYIHVREAGRALGEYHRLIADFRPAGNRLWRDYRDTVQQLGEFYKSVSTDTLRDDFDRFFLTHFHYLVDTLFEVGDPWVDKRDLRQLIIHEDYGPYNLIFQHGKISAVLDWMDAHLDWRASDLAFSLSVFACTRTARYDRELLRLFLEAYQSNCDIAPQEITHMPDLLCLKRLNELPFYLRAHYATDRGNQKYPHMFTKFVEEIQWLQEHKRDLILELEQHLVKRRRIASRRNAGIRSRFTEPLRILTLAHDLPFPPDNGTKIPTFHRLRHLSKRNRLSLLCIHSGDVDEAHVAELEKYCDVHLVKRPALRRPKGIIAKARKYLESLWHGIPYCLHDICSEAQMWIRQKVEAGCFDVIEAADGSVVPYLSAEWPVFKVVILHSVLDASLRRTIAFTESVRERVVTLANWIVWRRYEKQIGKTVDVCVTLTEQNRREVLALKLDIPVTHCLTNGIDLDYFSYEPATEGPTGVCFVGRMDYSANVDAVLYFYREIYPFVRATHPRSTFLIVGSSPTDAVKELAADPSVKVTGYVNDVRPFLRRAGIAVVPTRIGGGILNKILEALALGVPVVTNTKSIEGLSVTPGRDLLLADTPEDFAKCVIRLFDEPSLRYALASNGRQYVEKNHQWETIINRYEQELRNLLATYSDHRQ